MSKKIISLILTISMVMMTMSGVFAESAPEFTQEVETLVAENVETTAENEEAVPAEVIIEEETEEADVAPLQEVQDEAASEQTEAEAPVEETAVTVEEAKEDAVEAEVQDEDFIAALEAEELVQEPVEETVAAEELQDEAALETVEVVEENLLEGVSSMIEVHNNKGETVEISSDELALLESVSSDYGPNGEFPLTLYSGCPATAVVGDDFWPTYGWWNSYNGSNWAMSVFLNGKLIYTEGNDEYNGGVTLSEAGTCAVVFRVVDGLGRVVEIVDYVQVIGPTPLQFNGVWVTSTREYGENDACVFLAMDFTGGYNTIDYYDYEVYCKSASGVYYPTNAHGRSWQVKEDWIWLEEDGWHFIRVTLNDGVNKVTLDTAPFLVGKDLSALPGKNGLVQDADGEFRYYLEDVFQKGYNGIVWFEGGYFFVADGRVCKEANGLALNGYDWYFLANGQVQDWYTGLAEYQGHWFYVEDGRFYDWRNGLYEFDGGLFVVAAGELIRTVNGLWQNTEGNGRWYFISNGQVVDYTGLAMYDGAWFYVENGMLAEWYTGVVEYQGAYFWVVNGRIL